MSQMLSQAKLLVILNFKYVIYFKTQDTISSGEHEHFSHRTLSRVVNMNIFLTGHYLEWWTFFSQDTISSGEHEHFSHRTLSRVVNMNIFLTGHYLEWWTWTFFSQDTISSGEHEHFSHRTLSSGEHDFFLSSPCLIAPLEFLFQFTLR